MKLCIIADIHLPYHKDAPQYRAFDFALNDAKRKGADMFIFSGDITADGCNEAAEEFYSKVNNCGIPYLVIAGNSDLRSGKSVIFPSDTVTELPDGTTVFMIDDGERSITEAELSALEKAEKDDIVFMHHPYNLLKEPWCSVFSEWRENHKDTKVFSAHLHQFDIKGNDYSISALDPDKAIGECPSVLYYDTRTGEIERKYLYCTMPSDFLRMAGISCYKTIEHLKFSAEHKLTCTEFRPNSIKCERGELISAIEAWRDAGGKNLSVHFPDAILHDGVIEGKDIIYAFVEFVREIGAERITVHVPRMTIEYSTEDTVEMFAEFYGDFINKLPKSCTVGIENLHMKDADRENSTRPFGCVPEDCIDFLFRVRKYTSSHNVGINLDIGHARNNAPYSQKYTLGVWYAEVGKYCVGYHIHQVLEEKGVYENHSPVTENYGRLISLASFYDGLCTGLLADAPKIFEIRTDGGAEETVEFFENEVITLINN